jgi:hypothetical protein
VGLGDLGGALGDVGQIDRLLGILLVGKALLSAIERHLGFVQLGGGNLGRGARAGAAVGGSRIVQLDGGGGGAAREGQRHRKGEVKYR